MKANIVDISPPIPYLAKFKELKENVKDEVDFLPADIRQMFSQNDTIILGVWPGMPKLSK